MGKTASSDVLKQNKTKPIHALAAVNFHTSTQDSDFVHDVTTGELQNSTEPKKDKFEMLDIGEGKTADAKAKERKISICCFCKVWK
eukprot:m.167396 g.167396  ORF g.167396 m.167396 type:complete len:86 (+) comp38930_c0_seq8:100-357(+)